MASLKDPPQKRDTPSPTPAHSTDLSADFQSASLSSLGKEDSVYGDNLYDSSLLEAIGKFSDQIELRTDVIGDKVLEYYNVRDQLLESAKKIEKIWERIGESQIEGFANLRQEERRDLLKQSDGYSVIDSDTFKLTPEMQEHQVELAQYQEIEKKVRGALLELDIKPQYYKGSEGIELNLPEISAEHVESLLGPLLTELEEVLLTNDSCRQMNGTSLVKEALPHIYATVERREKPISDDAKKEIADYILAVRDSMELGIDTSYAKTEEEREMAVARMDLISDFHTKYNVGTPFAQFTYSRASRIPNRDYNDWSRAFSTTLRNKAVRGVLARLEENYTADDPEISRFKSYNFDNEYAETPFKKRFRHTLPSASRDRWTNASIIDEFRGFHKFEAMAELAERSGLFSSNTFTKLRQELVAMTVDTLLKSGTSGVEHIVPELQQIKDPKAVLPEVVKYLSKRGNQHFAGALGTTRDTVAFTYLYHDLLDQVSNTGDMGQLAEAIPLEQHQVATILRDPSSATCQHVARENHAKCIANPELSILKEQLYAELKEDLTTPEAVDLFNGEFTNPGLLGKVYSSEKCVNMLVRSDLPVLSEPVLLRDSNREVYNLLRPITLSSQLAESVIANIANNILDDPEIANDFASNAMNSLEAQSAIGCLRVITTLLQAKVDEETKTKIVDFANQEITLSFKSPELSQSEFGKLLTEGWQTDNEILVIGEEHNQISQAEALLESMQDLKLAGITDLALEMPQDYQDLIDEYFADIIDGDELSEAFSADLAEESSEKVKSIIDTIKFAKEHGVKIHLIDQPKATTDVLFSLARMSGVSEQDIEAGRAPKEVQDLFFFRRNHHMAEQLNLIKELNPDSRIAVIAGASHVSQRIEKSNIEALLSQLGQQARSVEVIGGGKYDPSESSDKRLNPEIFTAQANDKSETMYSGSTNGFHFIHLPQV